MDKKANTKNIRKKMLWWRSQAELDQIIQERGDLIIKDRAEINQAQAIQWK